VSLRGVKIGAAVLKWLQAVLICIIFSNAAPILLAVTAERGGPIKLSELSAGTAGLILLGFSVVDRALAARGRH
jgi:hypothetical protein